MRKVFKSIYMFSLIFLFISQAVTIHAASWGANNEPSIIVCMNLGSMTTYTTFSNKPSLRQIDNLDVAPNNNNPKGTTYIPLRGLFQALRYNVMWNPDKKQISIYDNYSSILLSPNSAIAKVNGKDVKMSEPVKVLSNRTMLPVRFVAENLGLHVDWEESTKRITVSKDVEGSVKEIYATRTGAEVKGVNGVIMFPVTTQYAIIDGTKKRILWNVVTQGKTVPMVGDSTQFYKNVMPFDCTARFCKIDNGTDSQYILELLKADKSN